MLGLGLVSIYKTNMTVNGLTLAQGEALFRNGMKNTSYFHYYYHVMFQNSSSSNGILLVQFNVRFISC